MNAKPDAEPVRILLERWSHAADVGLSATVPVVNPTSRIDYIFYRSQAEFRLQEARVIPEQMASDHRPVFAQLELAGG
jgi:endonuclease/exonuclease/phosphatase family metal-dependent hydrolase